MSNPNHCFRIATLYHLRAIAEVTAWNRTAGQVVALKLRALSDEAIAVELTMSPATVRRYWKAAKKMLKRRLN